MKPALMIFTLLTATYGLNGSESQTQILSQPILAYGAAWPENTEFKIIDVPYFDWSHQGHPAYRGIAQPNHILTNAPKDVSVPESNLLVVYGIRIGYDFSTRDLWLRLESARVVGGWSITVEDAAYAALECIRTVAHRYHDRPKLHISSPKGEEEKWSEVEKRFNSHDISKPFAKA